MKRLSLEGICTARLYDLLARQCERFFKFLFPHESDGHLMVLGGQGSASIRHLARGTGALVVTAEPSDKHC
ncbi:MAG: hypothetical protein GTO63_35230 [Anaerolineae bacterium]|nr:hypothetical protein [Anaerolineae bacterium]NIN99951.1 hypothetical protein [Anaerolineae bacterium]NIQ82709.1 hypothetical protein [Anaerolineae bacterium]